MKIETENMKEQVATEELVRELVRNDARRGDFDWETERGGGFSPTALRSLSHNLARDFAFVCVGLCFLHSYVSCNVSGVIGTGQFIIVLLIVGLSAFARWWIGCLIGVILVFVIPMFVH